MSTARRTLTGSLAAVVLAGSAACSTDDQAEPVAEPASASSSPAGHEEHAPHVDPTVVRGTALYDYEEAPSVKALASTQPAVTLGEVVGWTDGRSVRESDGSGYVDISHHAMLEVEVTTAYSALEGHDGDATVYVEVPRGGEVLVDGAPPEGTEPVMTSLEELEAAVPAGTRVLVLGEEALSDAELAAQTSDATVVEAKTSPPGGVELVAPNVQGLLFEDESGRFVSGLADEESQWGWLPAGVAPQQGFDSLVDQLDLMYG